jgi:hypothetical protein
MGWSFGGVFIQFSFLGGSFDGLPQGRASVLGKAVLCVSENPSKGWVLTVVFGQGSTTRSINAVRCNSIRSLFCSNRGSRAAFRWVTIN